MTTKIDTRLLRKTIKMMKKEGILVLKVPELELQLSPVSLFPEEKKLKEPHAPDAVATADHVERSEDLLFWSAPGQVDLESMN